MSNAPLPGTDTCSWTKASASLRLIICSISLLLSVYCTRVFAAVQFPPYWSTILYRHCRLDFPETSLIVVPSFLHFKPHPQPVRKFSQCRQQSPSRDACRDAYRTELHQQHNRANRSFRHNSIPTKRSRLRPLSLFLLNAESIILTSMKRARKSLYDYYRGRLRLVSRRVILAYFTDTITGLALFCWLWAVAFLASSFR